MTQTVAAMSWENAKVEIATDAAFAYVTDLSGSTNKVDTSGGEIEQVTAYTHGTMSPLVAYGAAGEMTIDVQALYTEVVTEAFLKADALYRAGTDCWLRITPDGVAGTYRFVSSVGRIVAPPLINGEAGKADFVMSSFKFVCSTLTPTAITP
jgi:hypothetical protein